MLKVVLTAAAGVSLLFTAGAGAQTPVRQANSESFVALAPTHGGAVAAEVVPVDERVMGLKVPNGFRSPADPNDPANRF